MASLTVRDVPDEARDELAARAARSGRSLQEYLRRELILDGDDLVAPHLLPAEVVSILRRLVSAGVVASEVAALAQRDLFDLPIVLYPFEPFAARVWTLRDDLTSYDAWYVALAEELDAPVATLDGRMSRSPGSRCSFVTPDV